MGSISAFYSLSFSVVGWSVRAAGVALGARGRGFETVCPWSALYQWYRRLATVGCKTEGVGGFASAGGVF